MWWPFFFGDTHNIYVSFKYSQVSITLDVSKGFSRHIFVRDSLKHPVNNALQWTRYVYLYPLHDALTPNIFPWSEYDLNHRQYMWAPVALKDKEKAIYQGTPNCKDNTRWLINNKDCVFTNLLFLVRSRRNKWLDIIRKGFIKLFFFFFYKTGGKYYFN